MRRSLLIVTLAALMVMAFGASAALAGEVTGSGKGGPAGDGIPGAVSHGRSACLFSGLEDFDNEQPPEPGVVQNWGHVKDEPFVVDSRGASWVVLAFGPFVFEEGCNPTLFDDHEH